MLAALPAAPAAPLSQKSRCVAIFGSPVIIARRVEKSCAVRIGYKRLLFHAFTLFKGEGGTRRFCGA